MPHELTFSVIVFSASPRFGNVESRSGISTLIRFSRRPVRAGMGDGSSQVHCASPGTELGDADAPKYDSRCAMLLHREPPWDRLLRLSSTEWNERAGNILIFHRPISNAPRMPRAWDGFS